MCIRDRQKEELDRRQALLEEKEKKIIHQAKEEARNILKEARETANDVNRELRALNKIESLGERNRRFDKSRKRLKDAEDKFAEKMIKRVNQSPVKADQLKIGDKVRVVTLDQPGEILSLPDSKGDLLVKVGMMKVSININDLMFMEEDSEMKNKQAGKYGTCLLYTSPSPRDRQKSRMPSSA